jgi:hypothetical protein
MNRMPSDKECTCDREMSDVDTIEFIIVGSRIELQCKKCIGIIGWWDDTLKKCSHLDERYPKKNV